MREVVIRSPFPFGKKREFQTRINHRIRVSEVRVIGPDGAQLGILKTREARQIAENEGLDLVEVSPTARPPVCKIMDYGKYKYEQDKKKREAKKHQTVIKVKEIKLRPGTDKHDLETKLKHAKEFLEEGNKVKITVRFRGREMAHRELGREILDRFVTELGDLAKPDQNAKFEGRMLTAVVSPNTSRGKPTKAKKEKEVKDDAKIKNEQGSQKAV